MKAFLASLAYHAMFAVSACFWIGMALLIGGLITIVVHDAYFEGRLLHLAITIGGAFALIGGIFGWLHLMEWLRSYKKDGNE